MKKNQKPSAPVSTQPEAPAVVKTAPVIKTAPISTQLAAPAPVFKVAKPDFQPPKGFASVLFAEVAKQPGTAADLLARLLASGEYQKVAPRAAELRPAKPVNFLLKTWAAAGTLTRAA
jgi:hypothetical protein